MKHTVQINLRLDIDFYEAMEKARGAKSRTAFIREAVAAHMKYGGELPVTKPVKKKAGGGLPKIPDPTPGILDTLKAEAGLTTAAEVKRYGCRVSDCDFTAPSAKAQCRNHPGALKELS